MIGIIDYEMGNLRSVQKAFEHVGVQATVLSQAGQAEAMDKLVLPGVGAFGDGMTHLRRGKWDNAVRGFIDTGKPFLGICLGMQLLFESSQEDAPSEDQPVEGLSILPGRVVRFPNQSVDGQRLKVPHMGWNTLRWQRDDPVLAGLDQDAAVYFVHGYYAMPADSEQTSITSATADYGGVFCASLWHGQVWATQFHPEKSQTVGLKILTNFASM